MHELFFFGEFPGNFVFLKVLPADRYLCVCLYLIRSTSYAGRMTGRTSPAIDSHERKMFKLYNITIYISVFGYLG